MKKKVYKGIPYSLWNPFTEMDQFLGYLGFGPIVITRGEGPYVYDDKGRKLINGFSSLWNVAVGHGRKELIDAAHKQMTELAYASCFRQTHPRAMELADKLVQISPSQYQYVYLGTNGSEAVETALKIARQYHKQDPGKQDQSRFKIVSLKHCYHGVSYGAMSTSGLEEEKDKFGPVLDGYVQIDPPYCYRCPYGKSGYPECDLVCAKALEAKIQKEGPETMAAFIMEPIMGAYGYITPPEQYYGEVGRICREHGVLFIVDEVTTGFGKTGTLFMSESWEPQPDIMCLSKAISSGYLPLAATLVTESVFERFLGEGNSLEHGSTASGHPVCAAVGLANIDLIIHEKLPDNAARVGHYLMDKLQSLGLNKKNMGEVRGKGLLIGIELVKNKETREPLPDDLVQEIGLDAASRGLLLYFRHNILGIVPPLIIDESIADKIVSILDKVIDTSTAANLKRKARLAKELTVTKLTS
ncbi:MAG: aspartate aminotransferase family protein [Bacteroidales bacterium]|nr:aspartate aminotransferase family protein [Bacteroidales bacterium]